MLKIITKKTISFSHFSILILLCIINPVQSNQTTLNLLVIAPQKSHIAWSTANRFAQLASPRLSINPILASNPQSIDARVATDILLMPLRSLATQIPELEILELPFFYQDISEIHRVIDGELGKKLRKKAHQSGWEILAFQDEGMHVMSGNRRYNDRINLTGMHFIELRSDPMAKKQFLALDAWTKTATPESQQALLEQCRVGSRSTSLQRIWIERLDRVHLALSLSRHRYEGFVLIVPSAHWKRLPDDTRKQLKTLATQLTPWQRNEAQKAEDYALGKLKEAGMSIHPLNKKQRQEFKDRLPLWHDLLSEKLSLDERKALVSTATSSLKLSLK